MNALVYPRCTKVANLEYGWEGRSAVILFSSNDDLEAVQEWYCEQDLSLEEVCPDQCHFFSDDKHRKKIAEVCFANSESFEDLSSYLGSKRLDAMIKKKPRTIGVLFIMKNE
jgi:hypothetical protein